MGPGPLPSIRCIDTRQFGLPRRGASYAVGSRRVALVETGTPQAAPALLEAVRGLDLVYIFVSHVHLDHAGSAGALAAAHPQATVVAHPRAVKHLADPRRLIAGVREASPDLFPLYGEPTPVPVGQLHAASDGERFDLGGGVVIEAVHAPGHAPHHACFFEHESRTLFTGDAVGNNGISVDVPLTVPPRFDFDIALETLKRLHKLRPASLAFTHFGRVEENADTLIDGYRRELLDWFDRIRALRKDRSFDAVVDTVLSESKYEGLPLADRLSIEMCVRGALLTLNPED